ncbi:MAG: glycosyltransferase [Flavobacteriaceae bacterium]|nr:glycosyltransferase [Flavobacteriaceae bacterium]
MKKKTIVVAPLNWGLGHSTRCIPIIKALLERDYKVVLASDGVALGLLKKEFPDLANFELPSYHITYASDGRFFKLKMILDSPKILGAMRKERKAIEKIAKLVSADGIISDNRLGIYVNGIPNVFITHQLRVLSGSTTQISSAMHQQIFKKYDAVWVPDFEEENNLTGELGHLDKKPQNLKYMGPLSRFEKKSVEKAYDLMVLLSGPEPQRTLLEDRLTEELQTFSGNILMVRGVIEKEQTKEEMALDSGTMLKINFMRSEELSQSVQASDFILCRSGYTTVMDLAKLGKKAFFIPTPGQYEQVHIAERLDELGVVPSCSQEEFRLDQLERISSYSGLEAFSSTVDFDSLFSIF